MTIDKNHLELSAAEIDCRKIFASRLRELRKFSNLSHTKVAKLIGLKSRTSIYDFEAQRTVPSFNKLIKLANLFNVSIDYLLGRTDDPQHKKHSNK